MTGRTALLLVALAAARPVCAQDAEPSPTPAPERRDPVVTSLTLFAGTAAGLWRSTDWGGTWKVVPEVGPGKAVRTILALGQGVYVGGDAGLFLSGDFGLTWKKLELAGPVLSVLPSRYYEADPTILVGTAAGLLKSVDGGRTFKPTALTGTPVTRIEWPGPALITATARGVLTSTDGGDSFAPAGAAMPEAQVTALVTSSFYPVDPVMFAAFQGQGLRRSRDGGRHWEGIAIPGDVDDLAWLGPMLYAAGERGLRRSEDNGKTWVTLAAGLPDALHGTRVLFPLMPDSSAEAFLGSDAGLWRTADGGLNWRASGLPGERVLALATFPPPPPPVAKRRKK